MSKEQNPATPSPAQPNADARPMTPEERAKRNRRFIDRIAPVALPDGNAGKHGPSEKPRASATGVVYGRGQHKVEAAA